MEWPACVAGSCACMAPHKVDFPRFGTESIIDLEEV